MCQPTINLLKHQKEKPQECTFLIGTVKRELKMIDKQIHVNCPVEASLSLIGGKYKPLILWHLIDQPLHYMELQRLIPNATPKMLSSQLHDLEDCGMIHREVIPEKPPKTTYSLTPFSKSVIPILDAL